MVSRDVEAAGCLKVIIRRDSLVDRQVLPQWLSLVEKRELRVGIIGLGYVGLPLVLLFSQEGFRVTGFDIDAAKVDRLNAGESYIYRIDPQQIRSAQGKGFRATANFAEIDGVDAILICVPTPLSDHHTPDMSYIAATMDSIVDHLRPGQLVVLESTTYPGTTEELIAPAIERAGRVKVMREAMATTRVFWWLILRSVKTPAIPALTGATFPK